MQWITPSSSSPEKSIPQTVPSPQKKSWLKQESPNLQDLIDSGLYSNQLDANDFATSAEIERANAESEAAAKDPSPHPDSDVIGQRVLSTEVETDDLCPDNLTHNAISSTQTSKAFANSKDETSEPSEEASSSNESANADLVDIDDLDAIFNSAKTSASEPSESVLVDDQTPTKAAEGAESNSTTEESATLPNENCEVENDCAEAPIDERTTSADESKVNETNVADSLYESFDKDLTNVISEVEPSLEVPSDDVLAEEASANASVDAASADTASFDEAASIDESALYEAQSETIEETNAPKAESSTSLATEANDEARTTLTTTYIGDTASQEASAELIDSTVEPLAEALAEPIAKSEIKAAGACAAEAIEAEAEATVEAEAQAEAVAETEIEDKDEALAPKVLEKAEHHLSKRLLYPLRGMSKAKYREMLKMVHRVAGRRKKAKL